MRVKNNGNTEKSRSQSGLSQGITQARVGVMWSVTWIW